MANPSSLFNAVCLDCSDKNFDSTLTAIMLDAKIHNQILLEGNEDFIVLGKFFANQESLRCINSKGRGNVNKIIRRLPLMCSNVIGIADRDYDKEPFDNGKIFYYDRNNFEMTIFEFDEIFECESFYKNGKSIIRTQKLLVARNRAMDILYPKSISRLVNARYCSKQHYSSDSVTPDYSIFLIQSRELNAACIKNNITRSLSNLSASEIKLIIDSYDKEYIQNHNLYDITQGHDFVSIFLNLADTIIAPRGIYSILNDAFSVDLFKKTKLYQSLKRYERFELVSTLNC